MNNYRVKMRAKSRSLIIAENVDLESAYRIVAKEGRGTSKHFMIEEIIIKPFSNLTARDANIRLERKEY